MLKGGGHRLLRVRVTRGQAGDSALGPVMKTYCDHPLGICVCQVLRLGRSGNPTALEMAQWDAPGNGEV